MTKLVNTSELCFSSFGVQYWDRELMGMVSFRFVLGTAKIGPSTRNSFLLGLSFPFSRPGCGCGWPTHSFIIHPGSSLTSGSFLPLLWLPWRHEQHSGMGSNQTGSLGSEDLNDNTIITTYYEHLESTSPSLFQFFWGGGKNTRNSE